MNFSLYGIYGLVGGTLIKVAVRMLGINIDYVQFSNSKCGIELRTNNKYVTYVRMYQL